ncbi:hypothetical protein L5515_001460 [Caenorhabditis briggsae]|uniref:Uncharacterized protein n=1 Tax=Caenorhabditis briggsae TaxID=6238 RepID=A0AAE9E301_CAEBR|nr:hypothetical protein L5515_001460 [Caenorhabditis briggsae]
MDWKELKLNPNFQVNRNRKLTNALKDGRLIKTLINQPIPPIMPLTVSVTRTQPGVYPGMSSREASQGKKPRTWTREWTRLSCGDISSTRMRKGIVIFDPSTS